MGSLGRMARRVRVEYSGAVYHLLNRGNRCETIFRDEEDRQRFIATLGEVCGKTGWQVHALCLMNKHFHLVVETPQANLVARMKWFGGTYTGRFNRRHQCVGHLFGGLYKALIVDGGGNGYLKMVCDYGWARRAMSIISCIATGKQSAMTRFRLSSSPGLSP